MIEMQGGLVIDELCIKNLFFSMSILRRMPTGYGTDPGNDLKRRPEGITPFKAPGACAHLFEKIRMAGEEIKVFGYLPGPHFDILRCNEAAAIFVYEFLQPAAAVPHHRRAAGNRLKGR